jgi:2-polyprenyl-6-methoxyphenol hydroxylase-like FAD-dependent oxidoreductase
LRPHTDGADSPVRREAGIGLPGSDYRTTLLMANLDAEGDLAPPPSTAFVGAGGILILFPSLDGPPATDAVGTSTASPVRPPATARSPYR